MTRWIARLPTLPGSTARMTGLRRSSSSRLRSSRSLIRPIACCAESSTSNAACGTVARRAAILDRERVALDLEIGRRHTAATIDERELERLALGQAGEARLLNGADMDEHVLAAIVTNDEAEALLAVEEFDDTLGFADDLGGHPAAAARAAAEAAATAAAISAATTAAASAEAIAAAVIAAATAAEAITTAPAATIAAAFPEPAAAEIILAETVAFVFAAPAALSAAPSVETHLSQLLSCAQTPVKTTAPG